MTNPPDHQTTRIKTRRGTLTITPNGQLHGLWDIVKRELLTNIQVRKLCGKHIARQNGTDPRKATPITRSTLIRWRTHTFPPPVLTIKSTGTPVELWSKSDVETWLKAREENEQ